MKCPSREHSGMGPDTEDAGIGNIQKCPVCRRYYTWDGVEVLPKDLLNHNPGKESESEDEEWDIDVLKGLY